MVFHAEGLAGIKLHYAAQLSVRPVREFKNGVHHFPAAKSALPAVNKPPLLATILLGCCARCLPNHSRLSAGRLHRSACSWLYCMCMKAVPRPQEICCNNCIPIALLTYIHTYIHTHEESPCNMISCLASRSAIRPCRKSKIYRLPL